MPAKSKARDLLRESLKRRYPRIWKMLADSDLRIERARHSAASVLPWLIRPDPRHLEVAITANCNLRCVGCRYGREFMSGSQLPFPIVRELLDDAKAAGFWDVRFYGGEPLLHPDLPKMIAHARSIDLGAYLTTNGILLGQRIDALYAAGLRTINIGYYGTGAHYDAYVQRKDRYQRLTASVEQVRARYGMDITLRVNWLLMRPSCNLDALHDAWAFAQRFNARFQVDLVHYSLPYFTEGPDRALQFRPEDRPAIETVITEALRLQAAHPAMFNHTVEGLRSAPDWLVQGAGMRVPCDSYQMMWVGADGTVQQCYVTYRLGNLHQTRLRDLLHTAEHRRCARDSFALGCPNCHCHYDRRVQKHAPSLETYSLQRASAAPSRVATAFPIVAET
ncbi:MAG TPA: radical SAM protein [Gemmatimonadaceae bacterium]